MPSLHRSLQNTGGAYGITVVGFEEVYRSLRRIEGTLPREVRKRLRAVGKHVAETAKGNAPHKSGALGGSIKVGLSAKSASVYSVSPYGGVQNVGGWSQGRGPHIKRANASHYMNKAIDSDRAWVENEMNEVMRWVSEEFSKY